MSVQKVLKKLWQVVITYSTLKQESYGLWILGWSLRDQRIPSAEMRKIQTPHCPQILYLVMRLHRYCMPKRTSECPQLCEIGDVQEFFNILATQEKPRYTDVLCQHWQAADYYF